jgi:hypothetical protein
LIRRLPTIKLSAHVRSHAKGISMTVTLKRQLSADEKAHILKIHGRKCFATGHPIPEGEELHFDHIQAFSLNGVSELDNIAPMCQDHNIQKGTLSLADFRVKLQLNEFFKRGDRLTVGELFRYLKERGDVSDFGKSGHCLRAIRSRASRIFHRKGLVPTLRVSAYEVEIFLCDARPRALG